MTTELFNWARTAFQQGDLFNRYWIVCNYLTLVVDGQVPRLDQYLKGGVIYGSRGEKSHLTEVKYLEACILQVECLLEGDMPPNLNFNGEKGTATSWLAERKRILFIMGDPEQKLIELLAALRKRLKDIK